MCVFQMKSLHWCKHALLKTVGRVCAARATPLAAPKWLKKLATDDILHVDAEGYDGHIIHGILDAAHRPLSLYFEAIIIRAIHSCYFHNLLDKLEALGYIVVYNGEEDALAIQIAEPPVQPYHRKDPRRCLHSMTIHECCAL